MFSVPVRAGEPEGLGGTAAVGLICLLIPTIVIVAVLAEVGTAAGAIWCRAVN